MSIGEFSKKVFDGISTATQVVVAAAKNAASLPPALVSTTARSLSEPQGAETLEGRDHYISPSWKNIADVAQEAWNTFSQLEGVTLKNSLEAFWMYASYRMGNISEPCEKLLHAFPGNFALIKDADGKVIFKLSLMPSSAFPRPVKDILALGAATYLENLWSENQEFCNYDLFDANGMPITARDAGEFFSEGLNAYLSQSGINYEVYGPGSQLTIPSNQPEAPESHKEGIISIPDGNGGHTFLGVTPGKVFLLGKDETFQKYHDLSKKTYDTLVELGLSFLLLPSAKLKLIEAEHPEMLFVPYIEEKEAEFVFNEAMQKFKVEYPEFNPLLEGRKLVYHADMSQEQFSCPVHASARGYVWGDVFLSAQAVYEADGIGINDPNRSNPYVSKDPEKGYAAFKTTWVHELGHVREENWQNLQSAFASHAGWRFMHAMMPDVETLPPLLQGVETMLLSHALQNRSCYLFASGITSELPSIIKDFVFAQREKIAHPDDPKIAKAALESQKYDMFYLKTVLIEESRFPLESLEMSLATIKAAVATDPYFKKDGLADKVSSLFYEIIEQEIAYRQGEAKFSGLESEAYFELQDIIESH